jgi:hypothetical protein
MGNGCHDTVEDHEIVIVAEMFLGRGRLVGQFGYNVVINTVDDIIPVQTLTFILRCSAQ